MFDFKAHLKTLVECHAPSGHEGQARDAVRAAWESLVDEFEQDKLGSLIGIKRANRPAKQPRKIMLAAHMDEIGLMVRDIVDGFVLLHRVSGIDNRLMMAQPVMIHGKEPVKGIVATMPPHLLSAADRKTYPTMDQLVVDTGLPQAKVEELVRIGDLITLDVPMIELNGGLVAGKAFDDRACVAIVTQTLHYLQSMTHSWDVYATATVQEESGLRGATTSAHHVAPDVAIALDVTFADQHGVPSDKTVELNGGAAIGTGPNFHPKLLDKLLETARAHEIKHQVEVLAGNSGTDAWAIQVSREGVPTALISLPIRNMHSPVETASLKDMDRCSRLLAQFISGLDDDFLAAIDWDELQAETE